jgi:hypothetical protein
MPAHLRQLHQSSERLLDGLAEASNTTVYNIEVSLRPPTGAVRRLAARGSLASGASLVVTPVRVLEGLPTEVVELLLTYVTGQASRITLHVLLPLVQGGFGPALCR